MPASVKVYVVVLNYRGANDTIECLLSLERSRYRAFEAYVVDNASGDGSPARIQEGVAGRLTYPVHFVEAAKNGGFAAGNNIGLRSAMACGDGRYVWLLNNDTVVDPSALSALVEAAEADRLAGRRIGQYGAKLLYYYEPGVIQAVGGAYNRWLGITREIGNLERDAGQYDDCSVPRDFINGPSIFARADFIHDVGLLREEYFLYFEEHDWAERGRQFGWGLRVVPACVVHHKAGVSIGAPGGDVANKSVLSDFCSVRSKLLFTARFFPWCLPTVYVGLLGVIWRRIRRSQWNRIPFIIMLMLTAGRRPRVDAVR